MKKQFSKIASVILIGVMVSAISISGPGYVQDCSISLDAIIEAIPSAVVWSDNFDDGNISDWNIFEINWTLPDGTVNFTVDPNELVSISGGAMRLIGPEWIFATFNSSTAYGTWTFDVDIQHPDDFNRFGVSFIGEKFGEHWLPANGKSDAYFLSFIFDDQEIYFAKNTVTTNTVFLDSFYLSDFTGWKSFIVTRELSGQFYVYLNGSLILNVKDTSHSTSERFSIFGMANPAIDNITVSDTIDYDAAPPEWIHPPGYMRIGKGEPFRYDLNATDYSGIDQWSINNTEYFTIDTDGVISNIEALDEGLYDLEVQVNDTLGNTLTGTFVLLVGSPPTWSPTELIVLGIGIGVGVFVVVIIWSKRR